MDKKQYLESFYQSMPPHISQIVRTLVDRSLAPGAENMLSISGEEYQLVVAATAAMAVIHEHGGEFDRHNACDISTAFLMLDILRSLNNEPRPLADPRQDWLDVSGGITYLNVDAALSEPYHKEESNAPTPMDAGHP